MPSSTIDNDITWSARVGLELGKGLGRGPFRAG